MVTSEGNEFVATGNKIFFSHRGTFWPLPLVTSVGDHFVSSGDEVGTEKFFIFFCKKGVRFSGKSVR